MSTADQRAKAAGAVAQLTDGERGQLRAAFYGMNGWRITRATPRLRALGLVAERGTGLTPLGMAARFHLGG